MRVAQLAVAIALALACLACGETPVETERSEAVIPIATQPPTNGEVAACMAALLEGILALDPRTGLGVAQGNEGTVPVRWPNGWLALATVPVSLVDANGGVVARVGDRVALGGGFVPPGETWFACPTDIKVVG